jgi:hypothetical protein
MMIAKSHMLRVYIGLAVVCLLGATGARSEHRGNPRAEVQFYIKAYGLADAGSNSLVGRAHSVFDRVCRVADKRGTHFPGLSVVNSPGDPWTISLPDGNIVLSRRALAICYKGVDKQTGDARLAFILGHELAHLANNDFWHMNMFMALSGDPNPWSRRLKKIIAEGSGDTDTQEKNTLSNVKLKEMEADDLGFVYAAISGFPMETLAIGPDGKDFFTDWMEQTHTRVDTRHPLPRERARLLQVRVQDLTDKIEFYRFGTRLLYFGRYEDALYFLTEFQKVFPSREVFNNLGTCYLRMALKKMPSPLAYRYWFPSVIDVSSRADNLAQRSGEESIPDGARERIAQAVACFERACREDTTYVPARLNLIAAYYYSGEIFKARAVVEEALKLSPDDPEIKGLQALIMTEESPDVDMWPYSVEILRTLSRKKGAPVSLRYNLAGLLEKRKRTGEARGLWSKLAEHPEVLPEPYRVMVLRKTGRLKGDDEGSRGYPVPWGMPVKIGMNLRDGGLRKQVAGWKRLSHSWQNGIIRGDIYIDPSGIRLLAVNDYVEMVILRGALGPLETLRKNFGAPRKSSIWGRNVLSFDPKWSVLAEGNRISEVWITE